MPPNLLGFGATLTLGADFLKFVVSEMLDADERVLRRADPDQFIEFDLMAALSRFCEFWIRKTIRKVTIVVPY
jgi:hypothetical protein